jgi:hypothetical protein
MQRTPIILAIAVLILLSSGSAPASAEASRSDPNLSLTQAEHVSSDLKQGMTVDEVQKLLGTPQRTGLKSDDSLPAGAPSKGTLQWTYSWAGASPGRSLRVDFIAKSLEDWQVNSWEWQTN